MAKLKTILFWLLILTILPVGAWIGFFENPQRIAPSILGFQLPEATFGVWLLAMLLIGSILGWGVGALGQISTKTQLKRARAKLHSHAKEEAGGKRD